MGRRLDLSNITQCSDAIRLKIEQSLTIDSEVASLLRAETEFDYKTVVEGAQIIDSVMISCLENDDMFVQLADFALGMSDSLGTLRSVNGYTHFHKYTTHEIYKELMNSSFQFSWFKEDKEGFETIPLSSIAEFGDNVEIKGPLRSLTPDRIRLWVGGYDELLGYMSEVLFRKGMPGVEPGESRSTRVIDRYRPDMEHVAQARIQQAFEDRQAVEQEEFIDT
jgi:hypothetical protein